jgi:hypothetical protein
MPNELILTQQGIYEGLIQAGLRLADTPENEGGWREFFDESLEPALAIKNDILRAQTALLLENAKRWQAQLCRGRLNEQGHMVINEATRSALLGGFSDYIFPIIRAAFPTNPVNDLVSVQPTNRRTATVVYWNWVYGSNKGNITKGTRMFDANVGVPTTFTPRDYTGEQITSETVTVTGSGTQTIAGTLAYTSGGGIRPGTLALTAVHPDGTATYTDDGAGNIIQTSAVAHAVPNPGTINYTTGAISITSTADNWAITTVVASYEWDSEGGTLPELDVQIITSSVTTQRRGLKVNYSIESMQDVMAEWGVSLEPNLISAAAEQMNLEIARQLITKMWTAAGAAAASFNINGAISGGAANLTRREYWGDLLFTLNTVSNRIWQRTQKAFGNWLIADANAASVIETMAGGLFEAAPRPANVNGLHFIGTLAGRYRVYKDIFLGSETGAAANGNLLMGYKGSQFYEAGLVWAPYQLLYTTDSLTTADFMTQKGMASRYAAKIVNPDMYARISITTS